jgi:EAL and modified HD-GYP domain-containing signal transduction protein
MLSSKNPTDDDKAQQVDTFVMACQPIFSRDMKLFAHELLFRQCSGDQCAAIIDYNDATNKIIADGFYLASQRIGSQGKVTVNVGYENIVSQNVLALPAERTILEIPIDIQEDRLLFDSMQTLKANGYNFLIDNYSTDNLFAIKLLSIAEYVKISVGERKGKSVALAKQSLSGWHGKTIAARLEDWEAFEGCKALGFDYFQGFYFSYPKDIVGKKISSQKTTILNLLRLLANEDTELSHIVDVISIDPSLSVRLLQFVNSATMSMVNRVDSLRRAASLVGLNVLKKWAMTAALSDLDTSDKGSEIYYKTIQEAIFLSYIANEINEQGADSETLYLLGLLKNMDAFMGMRMQEIVDSMPLKAVVRKALVRDEKEPLTKFLILLDAIYRDNWKNAQSLLISIGLPLLTAARLYMKACRDAQELLNLTRR